MSAHDWQKSSYSGDAANCIFVAVGDDGGIKIRESDDPAIVLTTTPDNLRAFIKGIKAGEFDHFVE